MTFSEFCQCFYHDRGKSSLQHNVSQQAIVVFIMRNALGEDAWKKIKTTEIEQRRRIAWFKGESAPDSTIWEDIRNNLSDKEFALELEAELVDPDNDLFIKTARKFELLEPDPDDKNTSKKHESEPEDPFEKQIQEIARKFEAQKSKLNKKFFAEAITAQLRALAEKDGISRNIVPEKYNALVSESLAEKETTAETESNDSEMAVDEKDDLDEENYVIIPKRIYKEIKAIPYILFFVIILTTIILSVYNSKTEEKYKKEHRDYVEKDILEILSKATTTEQQTASAEKLYNRTKIPSYEENRNQYYLYSAILKYNAIVGTYGDEKERLATQGLNLCQSILESEEDTYFYHMAVALRCLFFEKLNYPTDSETWKNDIKTIEEHLSNANLNLQQNEDAMLSSYGYRALLNYYEKIIAADYKSGSEELYKKYVEFYNSYKGNLVVVAYNTGSALPILDIDEFATYCEILFRLIDLTPIEPYQSYLIDIINTCADYITSYSIPRSTEEVILTSIKADAYYHRALIAENEINEYDSYDISAAKSNAEETYKALLKCENTSDSRITETIIKSIFRMIKHNLKPYDMNEQIIQFGNLVLDISPNLYGYSSPDARQEWIGLICGSCYNILNKDSTTDEFCDLGKRASERITPMDTYDLVITEKDIPVYKEFFENFQKEDDYYITPEESPDIEQIAEESEKTEENK